MVASTQVIGIGRLSFRTSQHRGKLPRWATLIRTVGRRNDPVAMTLHDPARIRDQLRSVADPVGFPVNLFAHAPLGFTV
jgi:hypothetical protein